VGDLSAHFSRSEFADRRTGQVYVDPRLVAVLECLRSRGGGRPLVILSGFRSAVTNSAVGGAPNSQHLYGRAADLRAGLFTAGDAASCGATGIGVDRRGWVVHVDVRPGKVVEFRDHPH